MIPNLKSTDVLELKLPLALLVRISGRFSPKTSEDQSLGTTAVDQLATIQAVIYYVNLAILLLLVQEHLGIHDWEPLVK